MANTKISALASSTTPLAGTEVLPIVQSSATVKVAVSDLTAGRSVSMSAGTISSGNLNFSSTAQRITGDFSNGTLTNRLAFQTNTVNSSTNLHVIPNGTNTSTGLKLEGDASIANGSRFTFDLVGSTDARIGSGQYGTGTYLPMTFYTGGSEAVRIGSGASSATDKGTVGIGYSALTGVGNNGLAVLGNVGIGTSSPAVKLDVAGEIRSTGGTVQAFMEGSSGNGGYIGTRSNHYLQFRTNNADVIRIETSGNALFGTTSVPTNGASGAGAATFSSSINVNGIRSHSGAGGAYQTNNINFQWNGSATRLWVDTTDTGSITVISDYRLKDKVETQTILALDRIIKLRPVTFKFKDYGSIFKADGIAREGFIAHELQAVIPSAVEGEKDAENQIQSLRLDALCSVMVKAIQEQQAFITSLTARIEALER